jgi:hypothetical protein
MYMNSVRNRPIPSAPASSAASRSGMPPMFAASSIRVPSAVTVAREAKLLSESRRLRNAASFSW